MTQEINLKKLEKKAWTSTFEDGLIDIVLGLVLLMISICQMLDDTSYLYPLFGLLALFVGATKRYITNPRMGVVKFSRERTGKRYVLILVLAASISFLPRLAAIGLLQQLPMVAVIVGATVFIIPCSLAYLMNWGRMYFYAILFTLSFALEITMADTGAIASGAYAWLISEIIMIITGVVYLVRFLKKYPLPEKEVYDVSHN